MRGLKRDGSARIIIGGHAFVQNLRCGSYELAVQEPVSRRVMAAFDELALVIWTAWPWLGSSVPTASQMQQRLRGLNQDRSARVLIAGHALAQNVRRGH